MYETSMACPPRRQHIGNGQRAQTQEYIFMIKSTYLNDLHAFASVARHQSFRKAAQERNVSASALSHSLKNLEDRLGVRLLNRTTRSVSATTAGQQLLARLGPALQEIDEALDHINEFRDTPSGLVRLSIPRAAAQVVLAPRLAEFNRCYPHIQLEIVTDCATTDITKEGFDAGIRFGNCVSSNMTAVQLLPTPRMVVVGAPDYLAAVGYPEDPRDLARHICIGRRFPSGVVYAWEFTKDDETIAMQVEGPLLLDDDVLMVRAALDGAGLAYVHRPIAAPFIEHGELIEVLSEWHQDTDHFHLFYSNEAPASPPLQAFIDFISSASREQ
ncbi:transcriptional regulator [Zymobacter palmae]|uniref:Transcriptional regulator n=2 Tax=Zymobacter palmae TaxID=33074 RepID=A0A348HBK1_9GAMM|nr:transcriptional regulator [Zymobacter palmae]